MITGTDHVAIIVSSEEGIEFYKRLGFEEIFRKERDNDTVVILECSGLRLEITVDASHPARANDPENMGLRHLALKVSNIDEIGNEFDCGPVMTDWFGKKYRYTTDPDGLPIEFHE